MNINPITIPKNLYHITTTENLAKIQQENLLKAMPDTLTGGNVKGIFAFDLNNFTTQWAKDKHMNLARLILDYIAKGREMVALRIPVERLSKEQEANIKVRDVNAAIDWKFNGYGCGKPVPEEIKGLNVSQFSQEEINSKPIEYIIQDDIPADKLEMLGTSMYGSRLKLPDILKKLFNGPQEEIVIEKNIDTLI